MQRGGSQHIFSSPGIETALEDTEEKKDMIIQ